ncbi:MAG: M4 family metallopeptidase [Actinomycetes bacterium]
MSGSSPRPRVVIAVAVTAGVLVGGGALIGQSGSSPGDQAKAAQAAASTAANSRFTPTRPAGVTASSAPVTVAKLWLEQNPGRLHGTRVADLRLTRVLKSARGGISIVRLQEFHGGTPVLGGQAVVAVDSSNNVVAGSAETLSGKVPSLSPAISAAHARVAALSAASKGGAKGLTAVGIPTLSIFDPRILGGPGLTRAALVWNVIVSRGGANPVSRVVYIDAQRGFPIASMDKLQAALNRTVCDAKSTAAKVPCSSTPSAPAARVEGGAASLVADVNTAYDYAGATYNFYQGLGRNSIDGNGMEIKSTVRYCPATNQCPYGNAFWNGSQMVYGRGYSSADDVVAHELTHGVTQYTSQLFYYYQSGAINEGLSDVFGEFVDLTDGVGTDTAAVRWKIGEDLSTGALRDMKDPTTFGDPDKTSSTSYTADLTAGDSGGVHTNSGVANKTAYLTADGGSFNGQTITGLGVTKAAQVWYQTQLLLRSGSDYRDLGTALGQACESLVPSSVVSTGDCAQVNKAATATELQQTPVNAAATKPALCETGAPSSVYADNFDGAHSWPKASSTGGSQWYYSSEDTANGLYAKSGTGNLWGDDPSTISDSTMTMDHAVTVPANGRLYFDHAYSFERNTFATTGNYDGGVVEYTTDGGTTWLDAGSLITTNGYPGAIFSGSAGDNPLAGRDAFVGPSKGYIASRLDLSSLAGRSVKFRFRIGTDSGTSDYGWFIDNFKIYNCAATDTTPPETSLDAAGSPAEGSSLPSSTATIAFNSSEDNSTFECRLDSTSDSGWGSCVSPKVFTGLSEGSHKVEVRASDAAGNVDATPAVRNFTVDTSAADTTVGSGPAAYATSSVSVTFSSADVAATFQCRLDSSSEADWYVCSSPNALTGLSDGNHSLEVRAIDTAGNVDASPAVRNFRVDTTAPQTSITLAPGAYVNSKTVAFEFASTESGSTFGCQFDSLTFWLSPCASPKTYSALAEGNHTFQVRASDGLLNMDPTPSAVMFTVDTIVPDTKLTLAPTLTRVTRPVFKFTTVKAADFYRFQCSMDAGAWTLCSSPWTPPLALKKATHRFQVAAIDRAGNVDGSPSTKTFRIN